MVATQLQFSITRQTDAEIIAAFQRIASGHARLIGQASLLVIVGKQGLSFNVPLATVSENDDLSLVLAQKSEVLGTLRIDFAGNQMMVTRDLSSVLDMAQVTFKENAPTALVAPLLAAAQKELRSISKLGNMKELVGPELSQFYQARDAILGRLESFHGELITKQAAALEALNTEYAAKRQALEAEHAAQGRKLETQYEAKNEALQKDRAALEQRLREVDARESRFVRRSKEGTLKQALEKTDKSFQLSPGTRQLRWWVHGICLALLAGFGALEAVNFLDVSQHPSDAYGLLGLALKVLLPGLAFGATAIFYLRWTNQWFEDHAQEEFRRKRLALDLERAAWLVEMAHEWRHENNTEPPPELLGTMSKGLFVEPRSKSVQHPIDQIATLLGGASALELNLPGGAQVKYDRKALARATRPVPDEDNE